MTSEEDIDFFDAIEQIHENAREMGHQEGLELGIANSVEQGEMMGRSQGELIGRELGFYIGVLLIFNDYIEKNKPSKIPSAKILKEITSLIAHLSQFPVDPKDESLTDLLDLIRGKFKLICSMLKGLAPLLRSFDMHSTQTPISSYLPIFATSDLSF